MRSPKRFFGFVRSRFGVFGDFALGWGGFIYIWRFRLIMFVNPPLRDYVDGVFALGWGGFMYIWRFRLIIFVNPPLRYYVDMDFGFCDRGLGILGWVGAGLCIFAVFG